MIRTTMKSKMRLNRNFPKKISVGSVSSFKVSAVWLSSSFKNTCANPDIEANCIIIHNSAAKIFLSKFILPIENETAVSVTTAKRRIELIAALERASCLKSLPKMVNML